MTFEFFMVSCRHKKCHKLCIRKSSLRDKLDRSVVQGFSDLFFTSEIKSDKNKSNKFLSFVLTLPAFQHFFPKIIFVSNQTQFEKFDGEKFEKHQNNVE